VTALHLARPEDQEKLLPLIADFHTHLQLDTTHEHRVSALSPILDGTPLGVAYLIGPRMAPIGYLILSFGWSMQYGGMEGKVDEFYLRPSVRGRGIGHEVLSELSKALADAGLKALHIDLPAENEAAMKFYRRLHFRPHENSLKMTRET
jgi:ribosomal protein S18 acetylase RimI-like enzyme